MSFGSQYSGIKILEIRIRNFRSLLETNVKLDWLTVLIGENNAGKTNFLEALFVAIGAGRHVISAEDVFLAPGEKKVAKDREINIDLLIRPTDDFGEIIDTFREGSFWIELWGEGVSQDDNENEFVAIRTQVKWDSARGEYITKRNFIDWQEDPDKWTQTKITGSVSSSQIEPLALFLLDAKRDIKDELQNRSSFWFKLVSDLDLRDEDIEKFEKILTHLNEEIISGCGVLVHVQDHLNDIYKTLGGNDGSVSIMPIPRHLRDMSRGIDISYATNGAQTFPLTRHGMGTRSLAAVLTFRAYTTWRQLSAEDDKVHPMLALEEPESHLHPQAQRALFTQIEDIPGQRIISTHSPYIASQAKVTQLRHFRKNGAKTEITQLDLNMVGPDDILKINRMVLNTRGELLFARALVLFEGEQTEDQALPIFAERYWGQHPNSLGITMIGVGGRLYLPFLLLANSYQIPWYIFSDGEPDTIRIVNKILEKIGEPTNSPRLFFIPDGKNFEKYISINEYKNVLVNMIINECSMNDQHKEALKSEWASRLNPLDAICSILTENKTKYGKPIAEAITSISQEDLRYPILIRSLFEKISYDLGLAKRSDT